DQHRHARSKRGARHRALYDFGSNPAQERITDVGTDNENETASEQPGGAHHVVHRKRRAKLPPAKVVALWNACSAVIPRVVAPATLTGACLQGSQSPLDQG